MLPFTIVVYSPLCRSSLQEGPSTLANRFICKKAKLIHFGERLKDPDLSVDQNCKFTRQRRLLRSSYRKSISVETTVTFQFFMSVARLKCCSRFGLTFDDPVVVLMRD